MEAHYCTIYAILETEIIHSNLKILRKYLLGPLKNLKTKGAIKYFAWRFNQIGSVLSIFRWDRDQCKTSNNFVSKKYLLLYEFNHSKCNTKTWFHIQLCFTASYYTIALVVSIHAHLECKKWHLFGRKTALSIFLNFCTSQEDASKVFSRHVIYMYLIVDVCANIIIYSAHRFYE